MLSSPQIPLHPFFCCRFSLRTIVISISTLKSHSAYFQLMPEFFNRRQICSILSPTETQSSQQLPMFPKSNSKPLSWCQRLPNSGFHLLSLHIMFSGHQGRFILGWRHRALGSIYALSPFIDQLWVPLPFVSIRFLLILLDSAWLTHPPQDFLDLLPISTYICLNASFICLAYISLVVCLGDVSQDCFGIIFPFPGQFVELGTLNPRAVGSAG